ncbi:UNVERIFIED_CONTAM: hypothetical protein Sradi_7080800 [Sesamum radiatum]|uniref:Uncharacterized protein n=1 Tax=Sesamum radiatum TaxID=300843 RepID=A0AAW2J6A4_SESRA
MVKQSWELPIERYGMDTFGNFFTTVQQAKQEATDTEKKFGKDPLEANLIAFNESNAVLVHALSLEAEYGSKRAIASGSKLEKGMLSTFIIS